MVLFESKIRYEKAPVRSPKINSMKIDCFLKLDYLEVMVLEIIINPTKVMRPLAMSSSLPN